MTGGFGCGDAKPPIPNQTQAQLRDPIPNLAKVGVEGSNPFALSRFLLKNQNVKAFVRGVFLLT